MKTRRVRPPRVERRRHPHAGQGAQLLRPQDVHRERARQRQHGRARRAADHVEHHHRHLHRRRGRRPHRAVAVVVQVDAAVQGPDPFVLTSAGHIAGIVNPPGPKARLWTNDDLPSDPHRWLASATEHKESWWDDWAALDRRRAVHASPRPRWEVPTTRRSVTHRARMSRADTDVQLCTSATHHPCMSVSGTEGRPLLLVNGLGANVETWEPLRRRARVADAPSPSTARAPGGSSTPVRPLTIRDLARVAVRLLTDSATVRRARVLVRRGDRGGDRARSPPTVSTRLVLAATIFGWGSPLGDPLRGAVGRHGRRCHSSRVPTRSATGGRSSPSPRGRRSRGSGAWSNPRSCSQARTIRAGAS